MLSLEKLLDLLSRILLVGQPGLPLGVGGGVGRVVLVISILPFHLLLSTISLVMVFENSLMSMIVRGLGLA